MGNYSFMDEIEEISLEGNTELGNYKDYILFITRFSKTSHTTGPSVGLSRLDGKLITNQERTQAIQSNYQQKYSEVNKFK